MKTKNMFFLLCLGLGVIIFFTSCDSKKESYNITGAMKKYLVERTDSTIHIFVKNDETKCYDSLVQFPTPKYAKITNGQIAYILDHPDQFLIEEQTYVDYYFDGVFLQYEKVKINYTIFIEEDIFGQKEEILSNRSGFVWSWIIGFGLTILGVLAYCVTHWWWVKKREEFDSEKFSNIFSLATPLIIITSIFVENFLQNGWLSVLLSIIIVVVYFFLTFILIAIDDCFEKIRICLVNREIKKLKKKEKNN